MRAWGVSLARLVCTLLAACAGSAAPPTTHGRSTPPAAEAWSCPPHEVDDTLAVRYARRGDYCEGMYLEQVASSTLVAVSLTDSVADIDFQSTAPIRIAWPNALPGVFHLQGTRIGGVPYDLDVKPSPQPWFDWPTSEIRKIGPTAEQLGFLVWSKPGTDGPVRKLYFPATIGQGAMRGERHPRLVVVPGTQLQHVTISLGPSNQQGQMTSRLIDARSAASVLYPARAPIVLPLEELANAASGLYVVEVTAKAASGLQLAAEYYWLYHEQ